MKNWNHEVFSFCLLLLDGGGICFDDGMYFVDSPNGKIYMENSS